MYNVLALMPETSPLRSILTNFTDNLSALRDFAALIDPFLSDTSTKAFQQHFDALTPMILGTLKEKPNALSDELEAFLRSRFQGTFEITKQTNGGFEVSVQGPDAQAFADAVAVVERTSNHIGLLYRSSLVSLTSTAEFFISQLIREHLNRYPDAGGIKDKTLTLEDLKALGSIEEAQRYLLDLRVDEVMRGSLEDWLKYLESTLSLSMGYLKPILGKLIEVFQRRNVVVHNNSVVHAFYIQKVPAELRTGINAGETLTVTSNYLTNAIDLVELAFGLIGFELWKKWSPADPERGDFLASLTFSLLTSERWVVADGFAHFAMNDKKMSERLKLIGQLNYWQCRKWRDEFDAVRAEIEASDFSAKDELFQLARLALLDDITGFFSLLPSVIKTGKLGLEHLGSWPIFREMRKQAQYPEFLAELEASGTQQPTDTATVQ